MNISQLTDEHLPLVWTHKHPSQRLPFVAMPSMPIGHFIDLYCQGFAQIAAF
jgi:hypothetical protein